MSQKLLITAFFAFLHQHLNTISMHTRHITLSSTIITIIVAMRKIWNRFFRKAGQPYAHQWTILSNKPISKLNRNLFAGTAGCVIGLWLGQYFPDAYYPQVEPYLPNAKDYLQDLKPNPPAPKSNFEYPRDISDLLSPQTKIHDAQYTVVNDVTKREEKYKVTRVFTPEKRQ